MAHNASVQGVSGQQSAPNSSTSAHLGTVNQNETLPPRKSGYTPEDPYLRALTDQVQSGQAQARVTYTSLSGSEQLPVNNQALTGLVLQSSNQQTQSWKDSQIYLARAASGKSIHNYYDITDFVAGNMEEEIVVGGNGTQQVILKSGPKKSKIEM